MALSTEQQIRNTIPSPAEGCKIHMCAVLMCDVHVYNQRVDGGSVDHLLAALYCSSP